MGELAKELGGRNLIVTTRTIFEFSPEAVDDLIKKYTGLKYSSLVECRFDPVRQAFILEGNSNYSEHAFADFMTILQKRINEEVAKHSHLKGRDIPIRTSPSAQMNAQRIEWTEDVDEEPTRKINRDPVLVTSKDAKFHADGETLLDLTSSFNHEPWKPKVDKADFSQMLNLSDGTRVPDEIARLCGCTVHADWEEGSVKIDADDPDTVERVTRKLTKIEEIFKRKYQPVIVHLVHSGNKKKFQFKIISLGKQRDKERTTLFPRGSKWYRYPADLMFTVRMLEYQAASEKFTPCQLKIQSVYSAHHAVLPREWSNYTFTEHLARDTLGHEGEEGKPTSGPLLEKVEKEKQIYAPELDLQDRVSEFYQEETISNAIKEMEQKKFLSQIQGRSEGLMGDNNSVTEAPLHPTTGVSVRRPRNRPGNEPVLVDTKVSAPSLSGSASGYNGDLDDDASQSSSLADLMSLQPGLESRRKFYPRTGTLHEVESPSSSALRDLGELSYAQNPSTSLGERSPLGNGLEDLESGFSLPPRPGTPLEERAPPSSNFEDATSGFSLPPRPGTPREDIQMSDNLYQLFNSGPPRASSQEAESETHGSPSISSRRPRKKNDAAEKPAEKKQKVSEPETRKVSRIMKQKKPSGKTLHDGGNEGEKLKAHNAEVLYDTFAKSFEQARSFQGKVTFEARLGRIVLIDVPKNIAKSGIDWTEWEATLQSTDKIRRTFVDRITMEFFDAEFICDLKRSRSELLFAPQAHEKKVVYEFQCVHKGFARRLVVNAETFKWKAYGPKVDFGTAYWDCPLRSWDARIALRGRKLIGGDKALYQSLVDSIRCEGGLEIPDFEFNARGADFQIKKIFCKRTARYMSLHGGLKIALAVTESQELVLARNIKEAGVYRATAKDREQAKETGHIGYSFELIPIEIERKLQENTTLEIGEEAEWTVEDMIVPEKEDALLPPFVDVLNTVIEKIDDVGYHNNAGSAMAMGET